MLFSIVVVFNWAISAYERIVVLEAKKYMGYIGMLMILWIFLRYTRFYLFDDYPAISTFLWYLYYFPFIFIPLYSFKLVQYFNYSYIWEKPKRYLTLTIFAFLLLLLILTNDFHHLVFKISDYTTNTYTYNYLYYLFLAWIIIVPSIVLFNLFYQSIKNKNRFKYLPILIFNSAIVYAYFYIKDSSSFFFRLVDLTIFVIFVLIMLWESILFVELIPVNKNHQLYFENASFKSQIMDDNKQIIFKNKNAYLLSEKMKDAIISDGFYPLSEHLILQSKKIDGGYIIWEEDYESINESIKEKKELHSELIDQLTLLKLDLDIQKKALGLSIKNELYDIALRKVEKDFIEIRKYISEEDLFKTSLVGILLKRKLNLILLSESGKFIEQDELILSIKELFNFLDSFDYKTSLEYDIKESCDINTAYNALSAIGAYILNYVDTKFEYKVTLSNQDGLYLYINEEMVKLYE